MDVWRVGPMVKMINEWTNSYMSGLINEDMDAWTDEWTDGWIG